MSSEARRAFDKWFAEHYDELVVYARNLHRDNRDLVHHTYLRVIRALNSGSVIKNMPSYFNRAMFIARTDDFHKLYFRGDYATKEIAVDSLLNSKIRDEEALLLANHLPWFDRTVLELYLDGWSMAEISRESGISVDVFYKSIQKSKEKLRHVVRFRSKKV